MTVWVLGYATPLLHFREQCHLLLARFALAASKSHLVNRIMLGLNYTFGWHLTFLLGRRGECPSIDQRVFKREIVTRQ